MQRKKSLQSSTRLLQALKNRLAISYKQCLPDKLPGALRGPDSFFSSEERTGEERRCQRRGAAGRKRPALAFAKQMLFLLERERGSKTAPFTRSLPGSRLGCVRHRRRTLYRLPGKLARASVPW